MKTKKIIITSFAVITFMLFGAVAGVYASNQGWLNFTGEEQLDQADTEVNEIMDIMASLNNRNITLEEAVAKLEDMNPQGLAKQNKELRDQVANLNATNDSLTTANEQLSNDLNAKANEIEQKNNEIAEKNTAYDQLQQERDGLQTVIDELNAQVSTLNYSLNERNGYIEHLEAELQQANEKAASHSNNVTEAVEEARTYIDNGEQ